MLTLRHNAATVQVFAYIIEIIQFRWYRVSSELEPWPYITEIINFGGIRYRDGTISHLFRRNYIIPAVQVIPRSPVVFTLTPGFFKHTKSFPALSRSLSRWDPPLTHSTQGEFSLSTDTSTRTLHAQHNAWLRDVSPDVNPKRPWRVNSTDALQHEPGEETQRTTLQHVRYLRHSSETIEQKR